jgi:hypothetical protein
MLPYEVQLSTLYIIRPYNINNEGINEENLSYTASTLSFNNNRLTDSIGALPIYEIGTKINISGSDNNDGNYTIILSTVNYLEINDYFTTELEGEEIKLTNKWEFLGNIQEINSRHKPIADAEMEVGDFKLFTKLETNIKINDKINDGTYDYDVKDVVNKTLVKYMDAYKYCLLKKVGGLYADN